jgi:DNA-binding NarL/FixJ family response regulator
MRTRELVTELVLTGQSNEEISNNVNVSISGVKYHISALIKEFKVSNRVQLIIAMQKKRGMTLISSDAASQEVCPVIKGLGV